MHDPSPPEPLNQCEDHQALHLFQPRFGDPDYLKVGDTIALVFEEVWSKAILQSHTGCKQAKNHSLYWNFKVLDSSFETGGYLFPGQSSGVLRGGFESVQLDDVDIILPEDEV